MNLGRYALGRLGFGLFQVFAVTVLVFGLTEALPGDAAVAAAGDNPSRETIEQLRDQMGLDRPAAVRYLDWLWGLMHGDLGRSLVAPREVSDVLADSVGPSLVLAGFSLALLVPLALAIGVAAAVRHGRVLDRLLTSITLALYSVPEFAVGLVLVAVFAIKLGWLPATALGVSDELIGHPAVLVLPVLVVVARPVCSLGRLVRAGMIDALAAEYVQHVRRLGLSRPRVLLLHALPSAVTPAVQQLARTVDWLLGGVIVVEAVFVIPGLGTALVDAVSARDLPVIQALAVLFACTTIVVNAVADVVAFRLAPRTEVVR